MLIAKTLSRVSYGFCFLFCLLLSSDGWSAVPLPDEPAGRVLIPPRTPLEYEIPYISRDDFENLGFRAGGTTFSSSTFRERATGYEWIGKSEIRTSDGERVLPEAIRGLSCRERIASDIYKLYGVFVPRTVLSPQSMTNTGIEEFDGQESVHILSHKIEDYHDYKKQFRFAGFVESLDSKYGPMVCHDRRCGIEGCRESRESRHIATVYETKGFGRAAAVATWLHDVDFIGGSATNIGYRITHTGGQSFAEMIMVDPGESFSDPAEDPYPPARHIRFARPGSIETNTIAFERLCPEESGVRDEFLMTLHTIIETNEVTITNFFRREGAQYFLSRDRELRSARLMPQLMERKEQLAIDYAPELAVSRAKYEAEEKETALKIINARPIPLLSIPDVARGYEDIYYRFINGKLIYEPNPGRAAGRIEFLISDLPNPLEGTFNLSTCSEDVSPFLSISTGYRRALMAENSRKVEVWIVPNFVVRKNLAMARYLAPVMSDFTSEVGVFWTKGNEGLDSYHSLTTQDLETLSAGNIYEKLMESKSSPFASSKPAHRLLRNFFFRF